MSTDMNKAGVWRHVEEAFHKKNRAVLDETLSDDSIDHTNPPGWPLGREGHRQILAWYHTAFPDFHYDIEHEVAEGNMVVVRGTSTGTHTGSFWHPCDRGADHDDQDASLAHCQQPDRRTLV